MPVEPPPIPKTTAETVARDLSAVAFLRTVAADIGYRIVAISLSAIQVPEEIEQDEQES